MQAELAALRREGEALQGPFSYATPRMESGAGSELPRDLGPAWAWGNSRSGPPAQSGIRRAGFPQRSPLGCPWMADLVALELEKKPRLHVLDLFYGQATCFLKLMPLARAQGRSNLGFRLL